MRASVIVLGAGVVAAVAVSQYSLHRQYSKTNETIERIAAALEVATRDSDRPSVSYQVKMGGGISKDDLRSILREELACRKEGEPAERPREATPGPTVAPASPASIEATQTAQRLVQDALSTRAWGEKQAQEMRQLRTQMTAEQFDGVTSVLIPAFNSGQIRVEVAGPAF